MHLSFLEGCLVKNLPAMQETWVWSLSQEDALEEEMATQSSILAWRILWTEEPGGLQSMGSQRLATAPHISTQQCRMHPNPTCLVQRGPLEETDSHAGRAPCKDEDRDDWCAHRPRSTNYCWQAEAGGEGWTLPHNPQKEPALPSPCSWTFSFQIRETIEFCLCVTQLCPWMPLVMLAVGALFWAFLFLPWPCRHHSASEHPLMGPPRISLPGGHVAGVSCSASSRGTQRSLVRFRCPAGAILPTGPGPLLFTC